MPERNTAIDKEIDIVLQMTSEHVHVHGIKQITKRTAKVTSTTKYV